MEDDRPNSSIFKFKRERLLLESAYRHMYTYICSLKLSSNLSTCDARSKTRNKRIPLRIDRNPPSPGAQFLSNDPGRSQQEEWRRGTKERKSRVLSFNEIRSLFFILWEGKTKRKSKSHSKSYADLVKKKNHRPSLADPAWDLAPEIIARYRSPGRINNNHPSSSARIFKRVARSRRVSVKMLLSPGFWRENVVARDERRTRGTIYRRIESFSRIKITDVGRGLFSLEYSRATKLLFHEFFFLINNSFL